MTLSPFKNVAIVGAASQSSTALYKTSMLGSYILAALIKDDSFNVTVISRQSSAASFAPDQRVIKVPDGYPEKEMTEAFKSQDVVILSLANAAQEVSQLVDAAIKAGVKRFIPSDFGSCVATEKTLALFPMAATKEKEIDYLKSKDGSGMTWTAIKNGFFFDFGIGNGFFGYDLKAHKATIWDSGTLTFSVSTREQIAKAVVEVLHHPEETANKTIYVSSFNTSMNGILASLEKATGKKWEVEYVKSEEEIRKGKDMLAAGNFMGMGTLAKAVSFSPGYGADFEAEEVLDNGKLALEKEDIDVVLQRLVDMNS